MGNFSVLPFLAGIKKALPDFSGMTSESATLQPQVAATQAPAPQPDMNIQPQSQMPPADIAQSMEPQGAPSQKSFSTQATAGGPLQETKAHKLLTILLGGGLGAAAGAGRRTFGEGFEQAQTLPLQVKRMGLQNQQLEQTLPFLRAQNIAGLQKTMAETQKLGAEGQKAQAEVEGMPIKQAQEKAATEASYYKEDPNMGLIDLRTKQPISAAGTAPLTAEEAQILGKQEGDRVPLKIKNTANEIVQRGLSPVAGTNDTFIVNKGTGQKTPLGIGSPRAIFAPENRIVPAAADPNNPGALTFMRAGDAMKTGAAAPQSAEVQGAKAVTKSAIAGPIGTQITAFNTALQHAELLRQAAKALNNGDQRTLAGISNRLETEFGDPKLTNFNAIANAYTREVTKMLSGGHLTDAEIKDQGSTMPSNANYETIDQVLKSYEGLARSKMGVLQKQVEQGQKGKANFPSGYQPPPGAPTATGPNGHKIVVDGGKWVDAATGQPIQ